MTRFILPFLLTACASKPADEADPATRYVPRGAHATGYRVVQHGDLAIKTWYPASGDDTADISYDVVLKFPGFPADPVAITGTALADAPVAEGDPYPLVVLSHGFGLNPEWYHRLGEHLASHGFAVFAPEHIESDWFTDAVPATISRPLDVSDAIDAAAALDWVDADHVAVVGHSYGGFTALAAAGARLDPSSLVSRCEGETDPMVSAYFCDTFIGSEDALAADLGLDAVPDGLWPSMGDPRVDAIVAMAGDAYLFGEDGLAAVEIPAMLLGGTADTGTPWAWGAQLAHDSVSSDTRALVELVGAEHMIATAECADMPFTEAMPEEFRAYMCQDPAWDKADGLDVINHMTTAWLKHTLLGDADAADALAPELYADDALLRVSVAQ